MKVVVSAGLMLIVFAAFLDFADSTVHWFGVQAGVDDLSFKVILSYLFYPLSYVCGSDTSDLLTVGRLTGVKIVANNILAYQELGQIIRNNRVMAGYNGTWHHSGLDIVLDDWNQTLVGGVMTTNQRHWIHYAVTEGSTLV
nr:hypothetical protein BaRGS_028565 [Batillaria attramentaria]